MKTNIANSERGMTLVDVVVVIALLAVIGIVVSMRLHRPDRSRGYYCINILRQNELALKTWAVDNNDKFPSEVSVTNGGTMELVGEGQAYVHFQVMSNELSTPKLTVCPVDFERAAAKSFASEDFKNTNVSYFMGMDMTDEHPEMIILGDRNLTLEGSPVKPGLISLATNAPMGWTKDIHVNQGNIGLADGSVQQVSEQKFTAAMQGNGTNRWVVP